MTREDLVAQLGALVFGLVPEHEADQDLTLEDVEVMKQRVAAVFANAEHRIVVDAQLTAEDVVDDYLAREQEMGLD
jgi:hypothetical protein